MKRADAMDVQSADTTSDRPDLVERIARRAGPVIVLVAAAMMVGWTWFEWPDPLVDFGRELYVAWQLAEGRVLYRDVAYFNGPLSPYFNAMLFRVFGVSLQTLAIANLIIFAGIVVMMWRLWAIIADHLSAFLATLALVTVFGFIQLGGIGNYNYAAPYSHELTHGMALSLGALLCVAGYLRRPRRAYVAGAGLLLGLAFLTKAEVFLAAALAVGAGVALGLWTTSASPRRAGATLAQLAASLAVAPLVALVLLWLRMPFAEALRGTLGSWWYVFDPEISGMKFYRKILGTFDLPNNLHHIIESTIWLGAIFGAVAAVALALRRPTSGGPGNGRGRSTWLFLGGLVVCGAGLWMLQRSARIDWSHAFAGLTLITCAITVGLISRLYSAADAGVRPSPRLAMQVVVSIFALVMLAKMFLNVVLYHYGFALAMPATLLAIAFVASWWPNFIDARGGSGAVLRGAAAAAAGFLVLIHLTFYNYLAADKPTLVASGPDAFWGDLRVRTANGEIVSEDRRGTAVNLMLDALRRLPPNATLATVPEGTMLNYLSRRRNPTPYVNLMPPEVVMFGQERIMRAYEQSPPDYIVLVLRSDPADYGYKSFAEDYGELIYDWIEANYRPVPAPAEPTYPLVLLERK